MHPPEKPDQLWIIVTLHSKLFAIAAENVQTMVIAPPASAMPGSPAYVRGIINLRGRVLPLVDLRLRLGMPCLAKETDDFCQMLTQREQDHRNWIDALTTSVSENTEFKLATDPHKCAFGKWYDQSKTENILISGLLRKFDKPHQKIHNIANMVIGLAKNKRKETALKIIDECRNNELAEMIHLFTELRREVIASSREIAIVVSNDSSKQAFVVTVDSVELVGKLAEGSITSVDTIQLNPLERSAVSFVGQLAKDKRLVLGLDTETILEHKAMAVLA